MKRHKFTLLYGLLLVSFTIYMGLDTFVLSSVYQTDAGSFNASLFGSDSIKALETADNTNESSNEETGSSVSGDDESVDSDETNSDTSEDNTDSDTNTETSEDSSNTTDDSNSSGKSKGSRSGSGKGKRHSGSSDSDTDPTSSSDSDSDTDSNDSSNSDSETLTATSYEDGVIGSYESSDAKIIVSKYEYEGTSVYVADVTLSSAEYIKTAFAQGTYGKNVTETTSEMASDNNAILAINGDNYGSQETGYVIRNGIIYRDEAGSSDVLCIYADGSMQVIDPEEYTAQELLDQGVWQAFSFGPSLVEEGEISVSEDDEVGKAKASNPRTAIGIIDDLHYIIVVSDGRTDESEGLSLYQLATFMENLGAETAYNLDGGGSSTMVFEGQVINNPTTTGNTIKEREVNDIVYIG